LYATVRATAHRHSEPQAYRKLEAALRRRTRVNINQEGTVENQLSLAIMEYEKLRDESLQAMQAQQSTLQWSMAAFGAIVGGSAVLVAQRPTGLSPPVIFAILGVAVPVFVMCCGLSWVGELMRMERIGVYLRGLELEIARAVHVGKQNGSNAPSKPAVLSPHWENFISSPPQRTEGMTKQRVGYIGSIGIYVLALLTSLAACIWCQWVAHKTSTTQSVIYTALCVVQFAAEFSIGLRLGRSLSRASRTVADLPALRSSIESSFDPPILDASPKPIP
jgi:hypothetical protein